MLTKRDFVNIIMLRIWVCDYHPVLLLGEPNAVTSVLIRRKLEVRIRVREIQRCNVADFEDGGNGP